MFVGCCLGTFLIWFEVLSGLPDLPMAKHRLDTMKSILGVNALHVLTLVGLRYRW